MPWHFPAPHSCCQGRAGPLPAQLPLSVLFSSTVQVGSQEAQESVSRGRTTGYFPTKTPSCWAHRDLVRFKHKHNSPGTNHVGLQTLQTKSAKASWVLSNVMPP